MNDKYDRFELKFSLEGPFDRGSERDYLIIQAIWINGENIAPHNPIDLWQLVKSYQLPGEFFIVTCGCGWAFDAGVEKGIRVRHLPGEIHWQVPEPISHQEDIECTFRDYTFKSAEFLTALQAGLREAKRMLFGELQPVMCSPYGFEPEDLLNLDPFVFSKRGAPLGCQILGKRIRIDHRLNATIDGIYYRLKELPVPEQLKMLDDRPIWNPDADNDGDDSHDYVEPPEWEIRRRMKLLGNYLADITYFTGRIIIPLRRDQLFNRGHEYQLVLCGRSKDENGISSSIMSKGGRWRDGD